MTINDFLETLKPLNPSQVFLMLHILEDGKNHNWEQVASFVESQSDGPVQAMDIQDVYQRLKAELRNPTYGIHFAIFYSL